LPQVRQPRILSVGISIVKMRRSIPAKMIRSIVEQTGCKIGRRRRWQREDLLVRWHGGRPLHPDDHRHLRGGRSGQDLSGKVVRIVDFGAFVEIFPGTDGLLHISEIAENRIKEVRDDSMRAIRSW